MNRALPILSLALFYGFGASLLLDMARTNPTRWIIYQHSDHAIIYLDSEEALRQLSEGGLAISAPHAGSISLLIDRSGNPTRIEGPLESNGQIRIINPAGIIVGPHTSFSIGNEEAAPISPSSSTPPPLAPSGEATEQAELIRHGNIYALGLRRSGSRLKQP